MCHVLVTAAVSGAGAGLGRGGDVKVYLALSGSHASQSHGWHSAYTRQWKVGEEGARFGTRGWNSGSPLRYRAQGTVNNIGL